MRVMILAAGRGERLKPLTDHCPKPLIQVAGKPLIEYHLERLARAGFKEVVINTWYLGKQLRDYLGNGQRFGLNIMYSIETRLMNTGGGIRQALPLLGDAPFLLINGDIYTDYDFDKINLINKNILNNNKLAYLILVNNPPEHPTGDFCLSNNSVVSPLPEINANTPSYTYSGIAIYSPQLFLAYPEDNFPLGPVLKEAAKQGQVGGEIYSGFWYDVGSVEKLAKLQKIVVMQ